MLRVIAALGLLYGGAAYAIELAGRRASPARDYDAIVVLGCAVKPDGSPSRSLERRARLGATMWNERRAPLLVLTGGVGAGRSVSEARAASTVAHTEGVPESALRLDERSTSTETNASEARALVEGDRVLVVTDTYPVVRARLVFQRYFRDVDAVGTRGEFGVRTRGSLREVVALLGYAVRGSI